MGTYCFVRISNQFAKHEMHAEINSICATTSNCYVRSIFREILTFNSTLSHDAIEKPKHNNFFNVKNFFHRTHNLSMDCNFSAFSCCCCCCCWSASYLAKCNKLSGFIGGCYIHQNVGDFNLKILKSQFFCWF